MQNSTPQKGFTIVELLIVIVVIGILAAITIVSFNGVTNRAKTAAINSDLSNVNQLIQLYQSTNNAYPTSISQLNNGVGFTPSNGGAIGYVVDNSVSPATFCVTVMNGTAVSPRSIPQGGTITDGACPGATGGQTYCPEASTIKLSGYYCDGAVGSTAPLNNPVIKQVATASGVPANAPTYYVGVQTTRDNLIGDPFTVAGGETYCFTGYAATATSSVVHTIGLMMNGTGKSTTWVGVNNLSPSTTWQKLSGCITVPSGYTTAQFWTQNNGGDNGGSAASAWCQTALMMTKQ